MNVQGPVVAAGAGRRCWRPKALVDDWLPRAVEALQADGCRHMTVVLGAQAELAALRVLRAASVHIAEGWRAGMGASLRAGLTAVRAAKLEVRGVVILLVDLPDVTAQVVERVIAHYNGSTSLAPATYHGLPGHPVLIGSSHWRGVVESATEDRGARADLQSHDVAPVECGDLSGGVDVDAAPQGGVRDA